MSKYVKKRVQGNEKMNLPWAFKKCQKYVKKEYMEMGEQLYLEP